MITHLHLDGHLTRDYYLCMNMNQTHRYILYQGLTISWDGSKRSQKLLLFCLSLQIKKMHLLATSKKPLLAPISPDNWTFWSSQHQHCIHMMQTSATFVLLHIQRNIRALWHPAPHSRSSTLSAAAAPLTYQRSIVRSLKYPVTEAGMALGAHNTKRPHGHRHSGLTIPKDL